MDVYEFMLGCCFSQVFFRYIRAAARGMNKQKKAFALREIHAQHTEKKRERDGYCGYADGKTSNKSYAFAIRLTLWVIRLRGKISLLILKQYNIYMYLLSIDDQFVHDIDWWQQQKIEPEFCSKKKITEQHTLGFDVERKIWAIAKLTNQIRLSLSEQFVISKFLYV